VLSAKGISASASSDGGKLKIATTGYGSAEKISVLSNRAAGTAGQLGIGTTALQSTGKDAVAVINGIVVNGAGQDLRGPTGSKIEGLQLKITATSPTTASLTLTQGIASQLQNQVTSLTDGTTGLFATRSKSIASQIKDIDDQIQTLNDRLDRQQTALQLQFQNLETRLSTLQSQGNFLLSQLSSLVNNSSSSSSSK
jgi:flagellar hook-associated protein 2